MRSIMHLNDRIVLISCTLAAVFLAVYLPLTN